MTQLKTLKDIVTFHHGYINPDDAKRLAIKWIKALEKRETNRFCLGCLDYNCESMEPDHMKLWIHNFKVSEVEGAIKILKFIFNITDEDLK